MHPTEQRIRADILSCFGQLGKKPTATLVYQAMAMAFDKADRNFRIFFIYSKSAEHRLVFADIAGVRTMSGIGPLAPGTVAFVFEADQLERRSIQAEFPQAERCPVARRCAETLLMSAVYGRVAEELPSRHAQLEFLAEVRRGYGPAAASSLWELLRQLPDEEMIRFACERAIYYELGVDCKDRQVD